MKIEKNINEGDETGGGGKWIKWSRKFFIKENNDDDQKRRIHNKK